MLGLLDTEQGVAISIADLALAAQVSAALCALGHLEAGQR